MTGPYILEARGTIGGRLICIHSMGTRADVAAIVNITPLTDLIVGNMIGKNPEDFFNKFDNSDLKKVVTESNLGKYEALVKARFSTMIKNVGIDPGKINLMNSDIKADHSGLDGILDFIRMTPVRDVNGALLPRMIITSFLNHADTITDDFTRADDTDGLSFPTSFNAAKQALIDIESVFKSMSDSFSNDSFPVYDDPGLQALFSSEFKNNGYDKDGFLTKICLDHTMADMAIRGLILDDLDLASGTAHVSFTVFKSDGKSESQYGWEMVKTGNTWVIKGNQQVLDVFVGAYGAYSQTAQDLLMNGLCIYALAPVPSDVTSIDHIAVTGPGIKNPPYVLSRVDGSPVMFAHAGSQPQGFCADVDPSLIPDNGEYVFTLFNSGGDVLNPGGYKRILKRGNPGNSDFMLNLPSYFATLTKPYQTILDAFAGEGSMECAWDFAQRLAFRELDFYYMNSNGEYYTHDILTEDEYQKKKYTETIFEKDITRFDLYLRTTDEFDRLFDAFVSKHVSDGLNTHAKEIIYRERIF
jgi:hypothetical protein